MIPHTPYQHQVAKANEALKPITERAKQYGIKHACEHYAWKNKTATVCTECGQILDKNTHRCPHCGTKIKIENTQRRVQTGRWYFTTIERINGLQVFRYFVIHQYLQRGKKAYYSFPEAFRLFLNENGDIEVCACLRQGLCPRVDAWSYSSDLILRQRNTSLQESRCYNVISCANYCENGLLPKLRRIGIDKAFFDEYSLVEFLPKILQSTHCETLWKLGYKDIVITLPADKIDKFWASFKIAIRHKYNFPNPQNYLDYLEQLEALNKDMRNPFYICPKDFYQAHAATSLKCSKRYTAKKWEADQQAYKRQKGKFFGVVISNEHINISVLQSIYDFYAEGNAMHHCVFANQYYKHANALILSAKNEQGERLATIEIDLKDMSIKQIRAKFNGMPKEYDEIKTLLNTNMHLIRDIQYPPKKKHKQLTA